MSDTKPASAPKRSLFKKPAWAAAATDTSVQKSGDFFRHSDSTYNGILAEHERRREEQAKKQKEDEFERQRESKRRRISKEDERAKDEEGKASNNGRARSEDVQTQGPITRSTPTKQKSHVVGSISPLKPTSSVKASAAASTTVIDLGDEESDDDVMPGSPPRPIKSSIPKARPKPTNSDPESEDEDEYTLELKRKAREKERLRKLGLDKAASTMSGAAEKHQSPSLPANHATSAKTAAEPSFHKSPPPSSPKKDNDPIISILIKTAIPDTKPLIVNRRASQNLQQVKQAWCQRQGFDAAMEGKVFFTWRGIKLWNTSTCTHILKKLKEERVESSFAGLGEDDGIGDEDPSKGRIEVEATTAEILDDRLKAKNRDEAAGRALAHGKEEEPAADGTMDEPQPPKEPEYVIQLKSPGLETLLLKIRPSTEIHKIMAGFKKMKQVDEGKTCWLMFDGERLDPDHKVADTELDHDDVVEVVIR